MPIAWVLNLEADDERARGPGWTPPRALLAKLDHEVQRLRAALLDEDDVIVSRDAPVELGPSYTGAVWSVTARALAQLKRAKVRVGSFPSEAIVTAVSSRAFAQRLRAVAPREVMVTHETIATIELGAPPSRVSMAHTAAGRGHALCPDEATRSAAISAMLARSGVAFVAEHVEVLADYAMHGWVSATGEATLGEPTESIVDRRTMAWRETVPATSLAPSEARALEREASETASALASAGYFGPFGIDAFRYRARDGSTAFCPRCEVNARFTMGWAVGMRSARPLLLGAKS